METGSAVYQQEGSVVGHKDSRLGFSRKALSGNDTDWPKIQYNAPNKTRNMVYRNGITFLNTRNVFGVRLYC